jgi:16S rRNA (adenine1518-N6/adenine1519-N6)-dimethyltransferase
MHLKPKKSLGQNFLIDKNIQLKIINACEFRPTDTVLEIGAGRGELTCLIAHRVKSLFALEIDPSLCEILKEKFKQDAKVKIINQDILKFNLNRYFKKNKVKVIGNIPYYISSPIIEHLFNFRNKISTMFITVQKEFGQRMTAHPGSKIFGSFSCFIQYHSKPKIILNIKKNSFFPVPKVNSSFLRLDIKKKGLSKSKEKLLFKVIRAAFGKRRKTLRNSLKDIVTQDALQGFFLKYSKDRNIRPENLSLQDFVNLIKIL